MSIDKNLITDIEGEAKKFFKGSSGCHDWTHIKRVRNLSLNIGKEERADLYILEVAALLHDVGRKEEMESKGLFCHAEKSAEIAKEILARYNLDRNILENIIHCIQTHRFRKGDAPKTIEAKVLFDADKLDSLGAIGVARNFLFAGRAGSGNLYTGNEKEFAKSKEDHSFTKEDSAILEYEIKLKYVKDRILTKAGQKIAQERHNFMEDFFNRFWQEVEGSK